MNRTIIAEPADCKARTRDWDHAGSNAKVIGAACLNRLVRQIQCNDDPSLEAERIDKLV
jgi:hypothetical protein